MVYLFSEAGLRTLASHVRPGTLCLFDFDGTLAPITNVPGDAALPADVRELLVKLAGHAPVGIITGRSIADTEPRLRFTPHYLIGNHGLEGLAESAQCRRAYEEICAGWTRVLHEHLAIKEEWPGVLLEDKRYSLSIHYRHSPDAVQMERRLRAVCEDLVPRPHLIGGHFVFNLIPQGAPNKGSAVAELMDATQAPSVYVGDDLTDEDVFRLTRNDVLKIRVGKSSQSAAVLYLREQGEIGRLLDLLTRQLHVTLSSPTI
jgi:trehalose 6-phosphate phosphatase